MRSLGPLLAIAYVIGCGKQLNPEFCAAHPNDDRCTRSMMLVDGAMIEKLDVVHLDLAVEEMLTSTTSITISTATTIDTTEGTVSPALPSGALVLASVAQSTGPNVVVIQGASIAINAPVTVTGDRPLIFVATQSMTVAAPIDVSAAMDVPGPGGAPPGMGSGEAALVTPSRMIRVRASTMRKTYSYGCHHGQYIVGWPLTRSTPPEAIIAEFSVARDDKIHFLR